VIFSEDCNEFLGSTEVGNFLTSLATKIFSRKHLVPDSYLVS